MKRISFCAFLLFWSISFTQAQTREKFNFNPEWKLKVFDDSLAFKPNYNDRDWETISLPHAWNEDDAFLKPIDKHSTGISWYRKHFKIPANAIKGKVFLEFEGVKFGAEIWINGKYAGIHENGVMAFGIDATPFLNPDDQENIIALRIDNAWNYHEKATNSTWQWNNNNFNANYGGMPKNVWLHTTGDVYQTLPLYSNLGTTGTYIYASAFDIKQKSAQINVESQVSNASAKAKKIRLETEVLDLQGKSIATFSSLELSLKAGETKEIKASSILKNLEFWSWGYGYLYTVITRIKSEETLIDEVKTKTGFRKTEFKDGMVYLNDRVLMMKGYAQRTSNEWPSVGMSVPAWLSDFSNKLMVESNGNLVRWMHVTPWKQDVESCDRVGLIQAMPAGDAEKDVEGRRWEQRKELMRDAIIYNRNSPSIVFYECGNESISDAHMAEMKVIRDQYDPNGGRAIGSREMLDSKVSEYGGEMLYINKSDTQPLWSMEYSRDEGLRKYWDEFTPPFHKNGAGPKYKDQDASDYNRNQDSHAIENIIRWNEYWVQRPGTGKKVSSGGVNIVFSDTNTHYRGEENYRRSGEVDAMRIPKDGFFAHKVMWDGWVNPDPKGLHMIGHWNYTDDVVKDQYVISAAQKVQLFLNGKSLGYGNRTHNFLFTFSKVKWEAGTLKAISYDEKGKQVAEKTLVTAKAPKKIKLTLHQSPAGFKADGADMVLVDVEVLDQNGQRCATALNMINFKLEGPAEWRGGIAQGPDNYILSQNIPVEGGVNRIIIRSALASGKIRLTATSANLESAVIEFSSAPVVVNNGISKIIPADGLPSNLERGETPQGASYTLSKQALKIVNVTAGANEKTAKASYDNNELSSWTNDGKLSTAWITYELAEKSKVDEVVLKLNGFRTKQYPILILVDDKEVFKGLTDISLGYINIKCIPATGKKVKIILADQSLTDDKKQMAEMNGKNLDDGNSTNLNSKGSLGIIEVEIYKTLK
ncbi:glycoside hydrolase family 2 protein [Pedobacter cryophilus]|uniref:Glycoside hydrolase family 2 protein n=1 Tax=Pedobacter cryophilus TaxID=2571271 RepID=A0A4U1BVQ8_9SPHI|nr:sugar-binding domain-containing protein [Pedobacter cryophilus]TKB96274.1 glycoside hydrolase family 2 protein [Pedobacter cryophilus]